MAKKSISSGNASDREIGHPVFGQPEPTPDPTTFKVHHPSDGPAYAEIDRLNKLHKIEPLPFPAPRGGREPVLTLEQVFGGNQKAIDAIEAAGQIVFHATGDCGSTVGPRHQNEVVDKMMTDFQDEQPIEKPQFNFLLGDIVYSFGERQYYFDQFYDPYRDYPAPVLAVAGNHDGMISPLAHEKGLQAFLRNFCAEKFVVRQEAGGLSRTAQIQPGVFFTFEAPFLRVIALYSNTLEDPGVIANDKIGKSQLTFLEEALGRIKRESFGGAVLFAHHHPPFTAGNSRHGWSEEMQAQIDAVCNKAGVWPHADLAGHAHNYQRFTRTRNDGTQIPYVVCGNGGHNVIRLTRGGPPIRTPKHIQEAAAGSDLVVLENYDDQNYGYLRIVATNSQLRIEYHPAADGGRTKTPDDAVTVDLSTRKLTHYLPKDSNATAERKAVRKLAADSPLKLSSNRSKGIVAGPGA